VIWITQCKKSWLISRSSPNSHDFAAVDTDWFADLAVPGTEWGGVRGSSGAGRNYQSQNFGSFLDREIVIFSHKNDDFDHFISLQQCISFKFF